MGGIEEFKALGAMGLKPAEMGFEPARRAEWLLPNGLGGYSSSTILGLNTRKYHGLLVASGGNLDRRVVVSSLLEELAAGSDVWNIGLCEFKDNADFSPAKYLKRFVRAKRHVKFEYDVNGTTVVKIVHAYRRRNAIVVSYGIRNNLGATVTFRAKPLLTLRSMHALGAEGGDFTSKAMEDGLMQVKCGRETLYASSREMTPSSGGVWYRSVRYALEAERGEAAEEDLYCPGAYEMRIPGFAKANAEIHMSLAEPGEGAQEALGGLDEPAYELYEPDQAQVLRSAGDGFIARGDFGAAIIAGYHWFADWGRDSMICLPGLTLVNGRFHDAELILSRYIDNMREGRIPTKFEGGKPQYYDYDGTLWMIDRLGAYVRYAGEDAAAAFIAPRWLKVKGVVENYSKLLESGLVRHKSGTWMDTIERNDAVEVQALWYNALCTLEGLAPLFSDSLDYAGLKSDFESSFMDKYWNGRHLRDSPGDDSIRPNQVIAASLEHSPVPVKEAALLLKVVDDELLTPCGLRTLDRKNPKYSPKYVGGVDDRAKEYHNGTVWPWLLGPYAKAIVRVGGDKGRKYAMEVIKPVLGRLYDGCVGTLAEVYDAEPPHAARGAVSQAWSVAEVLRALEEDT